MVIIPAIDIIDGKCVRLTKGDYATARSVTDATPSETAARFAEFGASHLHLVDLDGARAGKPVNDASVIAAAASFHGVTEVGGGIRDMAAIRAYLNGGVSRVILGSAAVKNRAFTEAAVAQFGDKIVIGIDAKDGVVATEGWLSASGVDYLVLAEELFKVGVSTVIFTDIDRDGTLLGPNVEQTSALCDVASRYNACVVASGGVRTMSDLRRLADNGAYGAICGKSVYAGTLDLREAVAYYGTA